MRRQTKENITFETLVEWHAEKKQSWTKNIGDKEEQSQIEILGRHTYDQEPAIVSGEIELRSDYLLCKGMPVPHADICSRSISLLREEFFNSCCLGSGIVHNGGSTTNVLIGNSALWGATLCNHVG